MKLAIATLGCKVNQYESEQLTSRLAGSFKLVDFKSSADIYVINTCAVTTEAEHKSRQLVFRARRLNPQAKIIAAGCYSELANEKIKAAGALIVGNQDKKDLAGLIIELTGSKPLERAGATSAKRTRAIVKIQDGCDQYCTYCVIPYLRGNLHSRAPETVISEINSLAAVTPEVVLTGIHLGKYGADLHGRITLAKLLKRLLVETDVARIRLSSIEPLEVDDELLELMAGSKRLARHLHLPLQSGDDDILASMNRPYTSEQFLKRVEKVKSAVPNIALTTDILIGFPGETEEHFQSTLSLAEQIGFRKIHVFKYSDRPLIPAAGYPNKVPADAKSARAAVIRKLSNRLASEFAAAQVGKIHDVAVESATNGWQQGLTGNYLKTRFKSPTPLRGLIVAIRIESVERDLLFGTVV